jgi:hypothetical protein
MPAMMPLDNADGVLCPSHDPIIQCTAPTLDISVDEEHDYGAGDGFVGGLGRMIVVQKARRWLREMKRQRDGETT